MSCNLLHEQQNKTTKTKCTDAYMIFIYLPATNPHKGHMYSADALSQSQMHSTFVQVFLELKNFTQGYIKGSIQRNFEWGNHGERLEDTNSDPPPILSKNPCSQSKRGNNGWGGSAMPGSFLALCSPARSSRILASTLAYSPSWKVCFIPTTIHNDLGFFKKRTFQVRCSISNANPRNSTLV